MTRGLTLTHKDYDSIIQVILESNAPLDAMMSFLKSIHPQFSKQSFLEYVKQQSDQVISLNYTYIQSQSHQFSYLSIHKCRELNCFLIHIHYITDSFDKMTCFLDVVDDTKEFSRVIDTLQSHSLLSRIVGVCFSCQDSFEMAYDSFGEHVLWIQSIDYFYSQSVQLVYDGLQESGITVKEFQEQVVHSLGIFQAYSILKNQDTCPCRIAVKMQNLDSQMHHFASELEEKDMDFNLKRALNDSMKGISSLKREYVGKMREILLICFALDPKTFLTNGVGGNVNFTDLLYTYAQSEWESYSHSLKYDLKSPNNLLFTFSLQSEIMGYFKLLNSHEDLNGMDWTTFWRTNKSSFPRLCLLARKYLAAPFYTSYLTKKEACILGKEWIGFLNKGF